MTTIAMPAPAHPRTGLWRACGLRGLLAMLCAAAIASAHSARAEQPKPAGMAATMDRGLAFLVKDAQAWKAEHDCVSCHHAGLVAWSLWEAKAGGYPVNEPYLAELTKWMAETSGTGKTSLPRPKSVPKAFNAKAIWLAFGLGAAPKPDAATEKELNVLLSTVKADQTENGSWAAWPDTKPPFFGTSDESMTALAILSLLPAVVNGDAGAKTVRDKGIKWLAETETDDDPQSIAMRLALWTRMGRPAEEWKPLELRIKERQNSDGGWSQARDMASDAWATGQALYALAHAGIKSDDPAIKRAHAFLIKTQRDDGSWPMTSRPARPGDEADSLIPIIGAGSAWAVIGLARSR